MLARNKSDIVFGDDHALWLHIMLCFFWVGRKNTWIAKRIRGWDIGKQIVSNRVLLIKGYIGL